MSRIDEGKERQKQPFHMTHGNNINHKPFVLFERFCLWAM